ncbi:cancer-related nucleoside-triphosphatase [Pelobates cultripes]|uniref:Cancer-related nucleoside-triphosphatase n=1 Tax=Pelobates cultripes TaxID=61616 RepID=A0AAD1T8Q5_PELCU|nr:cancer-related nucleoside-triphosphatase [Pelobates cultripes]
MYKHVFLTGPPGVGKTTAVRTVSGMLQSSGVPIQGFYTEEVRAGGGGGRRIGFDIVTLCGKRGTLSRAGPHTDRREHRVGQYVVDLVSFQQLAIPTLTVGDGDTVCVIDEIGKMELCSEPFIQAVRTVLEGGKAVIFGTIPIPKGKPLPLIEEIRRRPDVKVFNITKENRDGILQELLETIQNCRK